LHGGHHPDPAVVPTAHPGILFRTGAGSLRPPGRALWRRSATLLLTPIINLLCAVRADNRQIRASKIKQINAASIVNQTLNHVTSLNYREGYPCSGRTGYFAETIY
jgi:hypothetical protein